MSPELTPNSPVAVDDLDGDLHLDLAVANRFSDNVSVLLNLCDPCPADFDGDGTVGASDLALLLGSWGPYAPCPPFDAADFNEDCGVNAADLAQLLGAWGPCQ